MQSFQGLTVRDAARVTSLGSCLGAGVRRNMLQVGKRLRAFVARRSRFKKLRAAGIRPERILRIGGASALIFGQRALGVSDSFLAHQRMAAAACTCIANAGASLDLTLLIADNKTSGSADPALGSRQSHPPLGFSSS